MSADAEFMDRYSRQIGTYGIEAMMRLTKMRILIVGLRGVGIEVSKNLVLAGVSAVTVYDPEPTSIRDLGLNFFLTEADIGKSRGSVCAAKLSQLNPTVSVKFIETLDEESVAAHTCLVVTHGLDKAALIKWNEFCRSRTQTVKDERAYDIKKPAPISFISSFSGGLTSSIFVDHGDEFVVRDETGEDPIVRIVTSITNEENGLVRYIVPDGQRPGSFPEECSVEFSDVTGLTSKAGDISTLGPWDIIHKSGDPVNTFRIGDTRHLSPYVSGGLITEKKLPKIFKFKSLASRIAFPGELQQNDMVNFGIETTLHVAYQAILDFQLAHDGKLPEPNNDVHADEVVQLAKKFNETMKAFNATTPNAGVAAVELYDVDEETIRKIARHASVEIQPLSAVIGGVLAQEVVKITGKYTPIQGFWHFNSHSSLPLERPTDVQMEGTRYDDQIAVFGKAFQEKIANLRYFMVGCGALGCEYLKNFALMGVASGPNGLITVTDNDNIALSNLNRQFLFREHNVNHPKSRAACAAVKQMNPNMNLEALELLVSSKSEDRFNDAFWESLDGVCNALDNMEARFYIDRRCVYYEKPLLESGTMGPAGNVDIVVPHKTRTYEDGGHADEGGGIPMCTLRNFPHLLDHCAEWARDQFEALFVTPAQRASKFRANPDAFIEELRSKIDDRNEMSKATDDIRVLIKTLEMATAPSEARASELAFSIFHELFRDRILDLVNTYPADARATDKAGNDKGPFWSGHKRFPTPAQYSIENQHHTAFMISTTNLLGVLLGIHPLKRENDKSYLADKRSVEWINTITAKLATPEYVKGRVDMSGSEESEGAASDETSLEEEQQKFSALIDTLEKLAAAAKGDLVAADFEKDDDYNFHIDWITAATNLRCANYSIPLADRQKCKMIAGKIIPAIATTTAAVTGLVGLELYKVVQGRDTDDYRNWLISLSNGSFTGFSADRPKEFKSGEEVKNPDPEKCPEGYDEKGVVKPEFQERTPFKAYPDPHSKWDKIHVPRADMTLGEFVEFFKSEHKLKLTAWSLKRADDTGASIFPPPAQIDPSLLPSKELGRGAATMEIMRNPKIPKNLQQKYISAWADPGFVVGPNPMDLTLKNLIETKGQYSLDGRKRFLLDGLSFETEDGIEAITPAVILHIIK